MIEERDLERIKKLMSLRMRGIRCLLPMGITLWEIGETTSVREEYMELLYNVYYRNKGESDERIAELVMEELYGTQELQAKHKDFLDEELHYIRDERSIAEMLRLGTVDMAITRKGIFCALAHGIRPAIIQKQLELDACSISRYVQEWNNPIYRKMREEYEERARSYNREE